MPERTEIGWEVTQSRTGEVVWANRTHERSFEEKKNQIAESIAEGALETISAFEIRRSSGHSLRSLGYSQLILKAEGLNYLNREEISERFEALKRAIQLDPAAGLPHACIANLLSWQIVNGISEDEPAARSELLNEARTALRLEGNDPAVLLSVGTTYCRIQRYQSGLSLLRRAYRMAPTLAAKDRLARSLCFAGEPETAVQLFEEILQTMPEGYAFPSVRLAVAQALCGNLPGALESATDSTLNFPDDYYGWCVLANLLALLDRREEALGALAEGRKLVPKLRLETIIRQTEHTYGRTAQQREFITGGLRRLLAGGAWAH